MGSSRWKFAVIAAICTCAAVSQLNSVAFAAPPNLVWSDVWNDGQVWSDEAQLIAVAPAGDTFVVGRSYTPTNSEDLIVLHYTPDGTLDWDRRYNDAENTSDEPFDVELASNGDVLISTHLRSPDGAQVALMCYDNTGTLVWNKKFSLAGQWTNLVEPKIAVDSAGRIAQSGMVNGHYLALLYDADGTLLWDRTWAPPNDTVLATDIAIDSAGRVIVTGHEINHPNPYWTAAWDVNGNFLWDHTQPGDINAALGPARIAIDPSGDIVLNSDPETTCGIFQYRIWKLNPAGAEQWDKFYPDSACDTREPTAMAIDADGNIIVTGFGVIGNGLGFDSVKYNSTGTRIWRQLFHQPNNTVDYPFAMTVDDLGCIYIVGETTVVIQAPDIDRDFTIVKYAPDGRLVWSVLLDDGGISRGYGISLGSNRDVHVVGQGQFGGESGIITLRFAQPVTPGDLTGEGIVDITDLFQLLSAWGNCNQPCPPNCTADVNQDCVVDVGDLFLLLANWSG